MVYYSKMGAERTGAPPLCFSPRPRREAGGVGLGLYIVKSLIGNLKEQITATSEDGVTRFTFTLTLA